MIYNKYGSTDISVSAIGMGGMRFANQDDKDGCASLVKAAYDAGINYFDTAPGYGISEEIFGIAIKQMKKTRDKKPFYVSTKTMKAEPAEIRRQFETSLERLELDYIDFYHFWCVLSLDEYYRRKAKDALDEFERLKSEGLIKHICVSSHMPGADIIEMLDDYPFEGVLLGYSASNFAYRQAAIEAAAKQNRAVVVMNPLAGGVIPQNPQRFEFVKTRPEENVVEAALRFLLNDVRITVSLVGFSEQKHIKEAIKAVDGFEPIPDEKIERIRAGQVEAFDMLCTGCRYCDDCPEGIAVPKLMDAYNHYMLSGEVKDMLLRLKWHWNIQPDDPMLGKCTRCGQCESACTQKLDICDRIEFIRQQAEKFEGTLE